MLVEECLTGPEVSVDAAVHAGEVLPMFTARKEVGYPPYFEEIGHLVDATDPLWDDPKLRQVLVETHRALGLTDAMTHTEFKLTPAGPKVIEVNARLGGDLIPYLGMQVTGIDPGLVAAAVACRTAAGADRHPTPGGGGAVLLRVRGRHHHRAGGVRPGGVGARHRDGGDRPTGGGGVAPTEGHRLGADRRGERGGGHPSAMPGGASGGRGGVAGTGSGSIPSE